jgi:hypothetical protein
VRARSQVVAIMEQTTPSAAAIGRRGSGPAPRLARPELFLTRSCALGGRGLNRSAVGQTFIPTDAAQKRFEVRTDFLYPEFAVGQAGDAAETGEPR